jgi:DNA-binding LytR/AlgR family response regulator
VRTRAIVAEDESVLRIELGELLGEVWPQLDVVALVGDGLEAVRAIDKHAPDVLFLDIQMPGISGLDVARAASGRCHVAFVTAYDQHAVAAFEQGAVEYVMKPSPPRACTPHATHQAAPDARTCKPEQLLKILSDPRANARPYLRWIKRRRRRSPDTDHRRDLLFPVGRQIRAVTPSTEALPARR